MLSGPNQPAPVPYVFGLPSSQFHTSPFMLPSSSSNGASSSRKRTINEELREHKRPALNNRPNSAFKSGDGFGFLKVGFENPPPPQLNRALPNGPFHSLAEMEMGTPGVPAPVAPAAVQNAAGHLTHSQGPKNDVGHGAGSLGSQHFRRAVRITPPRTPRMHTKRVVTMEDADGARLLFANHVLAGATAAA